MRTRLLRVRDISDDDEASWRRLAAQAVEPNPFAEPDFLLLSSRHFDGYADARLVVAQDGDEFKGVLPVAQFARRRIPPRRVASTRSYPTAVCSLETPLLDANEPGRAMDALMEKLGRAARYEGWPGIVSFEQVSSDGPVIESLRQVCAERRLPVFQKDSWERGMVSRGGGWATPVQGKRRREIERRQRLLAKESGAEVTLVDRSQDPAVLEAFLEMEMSGWKGREGGRAFARFPDTAAWFREWHGRWAASGRVIVLSLDLGATPVAMQYFVRAQEGIFCFRVAHDEKFEKFSTGSILFLLALSYLRDNTDALWLNSATDKGSAFFLGMLPERRSVCNVLIGTGGIVDRTLVSALPAMTNLNAAQRRARSRWLERRSAGRSSDAPGAPASGIPTT